MNDFTSNINQLRKELQDAEDEFWREFGKSAQRWQITLGPVHISASIGSGFITRTYVLFNACCLIAGAILALLGGIATSLGVALVVGALFSFGAFLTQFWAVAAEREHSTLALIDRDEVAARLKQLADKRSALAELIDDSMQPKNQTQASKRMPKRRLEIRRVHRSDETE